MNSIGLPETLMQDLRYAVWMSRKSPGFTAIALLSLTVGVGANTAIFSLVDGILLRPLAFPDPDRLYVMEEVVPKFSHTWPTLPVSAYHFREWRTHCRSFDGIAILGALSEGDADGTDHRPARRRRDVQASPSGLPKSARRLRDVGSPGE